MTVRQELRSVEEIRTEIEQKLQIEEKMQIILCFPTILNSNQTVVGTSGLTEYSHDFEFNTFHETILTSGLTEFSHNFEFKQIPPNWQSVEQILI